MFQGLLITRTANIEVWQMTDSGLCRTKFRDQVIGAWHESLADPQVWVSAGIANELIRRYLSSGGVPACWPTDAAASENYVASVSKFEDLAGPNPPSGPNPFD